MAIAEVRSCTSRVESFWQMYASLLRPHTWKDYSKKRHIDQLRVAKYSELSQLTSAWSSYYATALCDPKDRPSITDRDYDHITVTYDSCSPTLSVPTRILNLNSVWSNCRPQISGFRDPPSALKPGNGFSTAAGSMSNPPYRPAETQASASPGPTLPPATASATDGHEHKPTPTNVAAPGSAAGNKDPAPSPNEGSSQQDPGAASNQNPPKGPQSATEPHPSPAKDPIPVNPINGLPPPTDSKPIEDSHPLLTNSDPSLTKGESSATDPPSPDKIPKYILGDSPQTLVPGSVATISGTVISLQSDGSSVIVDGRTIALESYPATFNDGVSIVIGSKTEKLDIAPGTSLLVGGKTIPLTALSGDMTGDASVVIGTRTVPLSVYMSGLGGVSGVGTGTVSMGAALGTLVDRAVWVSGLIVAGFTTGIVLL